MIKIFGTEVVQKGTELDLVVALVPKRICTEMDYPVVPNVTGTKCRSD